MAVTDEDIEKKKKKVSIHIKRSKKYTRQPEFLACTSLAHQMGSPSLQVLLKTFMLKDAQSQCSHFKKGGVLTANSIEMLTC